MKNLILWICLCISSVAMCQKSHVNYYYFHGEKVYLKIDTQRVGITTDSAEEDILKSYFPSAQRITPFKQNDARCIPFDGKKDRNKSLFYAEVVLTEPLSENDYYSMLKTMSAKQGIIMASPCFRTENNKRLGASNKIYVKLKQSNLLERLKELSQKYDFTIAGYDEYFPLMYTIECKKGSVLNTMQLASLLYETASFEFAEPELMMQDLLLSSDPLFGDQWALKNTGQYGGVAGVDIKVEQAWTLTKGSGIKVAVFDTGIELSHPDLSANISGAGHDVDTHSLISPSIAYWGHGTACAGLVGAVENNIGITGVAPQCSLISVSTEYQLTPPIDLKAGIEWAANPTQGAADVIICSWGMGNPSSVVELGITYALTSGRLVSGTALGTIVVFGSGNDNSSTAILYPASSASNNVISVGAVSYCGARKSPTSCDGMTSWGSSYSDDYDLDIMAPGIKISTTDRVGDNMGDSPVDPELFAGDYNLYSYYPSGDYTNLDYTKWFFGTSAACPIVAGVAALVLSANPNLTALQVKNIIEQSGQKISPLSPATPYPYATTSGRPNGTWCAEMGHGVVNADKAVLLANPCPTSQNIVTDVSSGVDQRQANVTITAQNKISSGANGIYHAGTSVVLKPGFHAVNGSKFRGYISTCTGTYVGRPANDSDKATDVDNDFSENLTVNDNITVYPNPFENRLTITSGNLKMLKATITAIDGKRIFTQLMNNETQHELSTSDWAKGIYILTVETESGKTFINKVIKK